MGGIGPSDGFLTVEAVPSVGGAEIGIRQKDKLVGVHAVGFIEFIAIGGDVAQTEDVGIGFTLRVKDEVIYSAGKVLNGLLILCGTVADGIILGSAVCLDALMPEGLHKTALRRGDRQRITKDILTHNVVG